MAKFTEVEANASKIVEAQTKTVDGEHEYWMLGVICADGHKHKWQNYTLSSDASKEDVEAAIKKHLTEVEEKRVPKNVVKYKSYLQDWYLE